MYRLSFQAAYYNPYLCLLLVIMTVAKEVVRGCSVRSNKISVRRRWSGHVPCETKSQC